ncbi:hypothetical protein [Pelagibius sp. Alg239-R121]|uniref:hypothetical protein n=1 Tax=Pelagibius sp. Alg239-R121 TaxID=2993448 RepID=UPI0024A70717|nr:hypothetical protein [Pelagibius sp. Alg239-R121]
MPNDDVISAVIEDLVVTAEVDDDDDDDDDQSERRGSWHQIQQVQPTAKPKASSTLGTNPRRRAAMQVAKGTARVGLTGASIGTGVATGATMGWMAVATGATLAAGPIGILVASTALTLTSSAINIRSAYKTQQHIRGLERIQANSGSFACFGAAGPKHTAIAHTILPYVIAKKKKKVVRKSAKAIPIIGSTIEGARSGIKSLHKRRMGTRGVDRELHAETLANHHCNSDCGMTAAIIAELFSVDIADAEAARQCSIPQLAALIAIKFKSV